MSDDQHREYLNELNQPYSNEELDEHLNDRLLKSLFEMTHAHNYFLIKLVQEWINYTTGKGKRPKRNLWKFLIPGRNHDNPACDRLNDIADNFSGYSYGTAPTLPIAFFCSRSTATLIAKLEELHYTPHLDTIDRAAKDFFTIVTNASQHDYSPSELKAVLKKTVDDFVSACEENAKELHQYLLAYVRGHKPSRPATKEDVEEIVKPLAVKQDAALASLSDTSQTVKSIEKYVKKSQRKKRCNYSLDQLNSIHTLWLTAKQDPNVKSCSKHKACMEASLTYYKREFAALSVCTVNHLKNALKAWSRRNPA